MLSLEIYKIRGDVRLVAKKYIYLLDNIRKSIFYKIFLYIILPVLITFFINVYINIFYANQLRNNAIEQQEKSLNMVSNYVNETLQQVLTSSNLLALNDYLTDAMYRINTNYLSNIPEEVSVLETLRKYKGMSKFISGVALVERNEKYVLSDSASTSMQDYFNDINKYEDYPFNFWDKLDVPTSGYTILAPVRKSESDSMVIPLVTSGFFDIKSKNLLIIDIDCKEITDMFLKTDIKGYGKMYIYDPVTNISIGSKNNDSEHALFDNPGFVELLQRQQTFNYKFKGEEYLIIRSSGEKGIFSRYFYVSIIPLKVLFRAFDNSRMLIMGISIIALFLITILTYWFSRVLYSPIQKMKNQLIGASTNSEVGKQDEFEFIDKQLKVIIDMNKNMKLQLQTVLPLICEQYFLNLLNSEDDISDSDTNGFLHENGIFFSEDYFVVATIKLKYTEKFYETYNHDQYVEINSELYDLFQRVFHSEYTSILITSKKDSLVLIINAKDNDKCFDEIIEVLANTVKVFETDKELLTVNIGVGNAYPEYEGMRRSYKESQNVSMLQLNSARSDLSIYSAKQDMNGHFTYTIDDENKLFNCMVKGDIEEVNNVIQKVVDSNLKQGIDQFGIKHLYQQIFNTAVKVLQVKGITEDGLMQEKYINVNLVVDMIDIETLIEYINQFVIEAVSYSNLSATKLDLKGIIDYIDHNFQSDIYLETIAEQFHTSSKYLSRLIKNHLGISFGDYLARLRIEKAKELLTETDMAINDIVEKAGFNSRNTFIRTFKKHVGMVPSEYRNYL